jgi:CRISPR-associated protein Csm3
VRDGFLLPQVEVQEEDASGQQVSKRVSWESLKARTDLPYTEVKWEAVLDVITSAATPRQMERVPAGALFGIDMVFDMYDAHDRDQCLKIVFEGLRLVEDDYLGGSGSRGYGRVVFHNLQVGWQPIAHYADPEARPIPVFGKEQIATPQEALKAWSKVTETIEWPQAGG